VEVLRANDEARALIRAREAEEARLAKEAEQAQERELLALRLDVLKDRGRAMAVRAGLPVEWQAKVAADLETFVTAERFPMSLSEAEEQALLEARVQARVLAFESARERVEAETERRPVAEVDRNRLRVLVSAGLERARWAMIGWGTADRARAQHELERELREEVEPDSSLEEVYQVVDEFLEEWTSEENEELEGASDEFEEGDAEEDEGNDQEDEDGGEDEFVGVDEDDEDDEEEFDSDEEGDD
jgi:hypothetical protein